MGILSLLVFLPVAGCLGLLVWPRERENGLKWFALLVAVADFVVSLRIYQVFRSGVAAMQLEEKVPWVRSLGASYHLGVDGISLFLILLTTLLTAIAILSSWTAIHKRLKEYLISLLLLETGMLGVFVSLDLVLFYFFWEAMLIPMYLLIGIWGGERRIYAAVKFFLYTMVGSVLMLLAILVVYFTHQRETSVFTTDLLTLYGTHFTPGTEAWLFAAFFLAFAIKVPLFPFHTWLPDAHVEAPTAGSVILAGVLLKMGTYGFLRFSLPLFPHATVQFLPGVMALAVIGIIYGAMVAMVQPDLKKLVAYSSVSHLGFVVLGLFALNTQGMEGAILQMLNHGVSTGALFLLVGIIYERRHTRLISEFGGLWKALPIWAAFFMVVMFSSIGLPGTNGFVGEFLILVGAFQQHRLATVLASTGVILGAVYMLWMYQRVMFGKLDNPENQKLKDMNHREQWVLIPLLVLIFWMGLYPRPFLSRMEPSVTALLRDINARAAEPVLASEEAPRTGLKSATGTAAVLPAAATAPAAGESGAEAAR